MCEADRLANLIPFGNLLLSTDMGGFFRACADELERRGATHEQAESEALRMLEEKQPSGSE